MNQNIKKAVTPYRIMHVTHNMDFGGAEQVIRHLAFGLDDEKYICSVLCVDGHVGQIGKAMEKEGIKHYILSRRPGFDFKTAYSLRCIVKENSVDVIHCHQYTPFCYGAIATIGTKAKLIFTEHGRFHPDRYSWKRRFVNQLLHRLANKITCISEATRDALACYEWIPRKKIDIVYNGIKKPTNQFLEGSVRNSLNITKDTFVIGTIARMDEIKNQRLMISAFAEFHNSTPDSILILAGDGPQRKDLEMQAARLGVIQSVFFTGFVVEIADYLSAMDVFLLTSFSEGTSMTLLEAMAVGTPIIATKVGGNTEVIKHNQTGLLIESGDKSGLLDNLKKIKTDVFLRKKLVKNAQESFEKNFSESKMSSEYEYLYSKLLNLR